jgi:hypothetical protein
MIQSSVLSVCLHHRKQHTQREKEEEEKILCTYPIKGTSPAITPRVFSVCLFEVRLDVFPLLVSIFFPMKNSITGRSCTAQLQQQRHE